MKRLIALIVLGMLIVPATVNAQQAAEQSLQQSATGLGLQQPRSGFQGSSPEIIPENSGLNQTGNDGSISLSNIPNTTTAQVTPENSGPISKTVLLVLLCAVAITAYSFWSWSVRGQM